MKRLDSIELNDPFKWSDEFAGRRDQEQERSITGAFLVQEGLKLHGQPITLKSNDGVWTPLSVVRQLGVSRDLQPGRRSAAGGYAVDQTGQPS